jgi:hypothetical protein
LASARLDQLLALADEMAARKRVTRPATERIPIFNGQMLKMLGRTRPTADCPLFFSEADWAALLELIRSEMDKVVNDGADDSRDGTFEAMVHVARPSTKRKRGAAADAGGQSLGLVIAEQNMARDERAASRSNREREQQQQQQQQQQQEEEEDEQEEERQQQRQRQRQRQQQQQEQQRQQQQQQEQEQEQRETENQAMREATAASLLTAEAERDAAAANTLFASIMELPLFKERHEQSLRVDAAYRDAPKCLICTSAVTIPLMCKTCTYKPVCVFCVVKFAAAHQNGADGDKVPCPTCKTPRFTAADLRDMFSGENCLGETMHQVHQMLVDTMLELARVKDIEEKGLVCEV